MKKTEWSTIKQWYVQGEQTPEGLKYPTLEELAKRSSRNASVIRRTAAKEKWGELRKQFIVKVENLTTEKKSTVMAGESVEFDSECLSAARKGLTLVNKELDTLLKDAPETLKGEELMKYVLGRIDGVTKYGKALNDYQKAGRLAFGEATDKQDTSGHVTISVQSEKGKELTAQILSGKGTE